MVIKLISKVYILCVFMNNNTYLGVCFFLNNKTLQVITLKKVEIL